MRMVAETSTRLPARPASVPAARRFIVDALRSWGAPEVADVVRLLASEIVTNAIVHARSDVALRVVLMDDRVRVEVHDGSDQLPVPVSSSLPDGPGKGLRVVATLAGAWGVEPTEGGKTVWVEVPREGGGHGGPSGMAPTGGAGGG